MAFSFDREWAFAVKASEKDLAKVIKESVKELLIDIIDATPVDTGLLKGNWQTSLNAPISDKLEDTSSSGSTPKQLSARALGQYKLGQTIYFVNNLDYANVIEFGQHSQQAPYGMVRVNIARFQTILDSNSKKNL